MNRLGREKSPYLLQHAQNPVDWYPWGEEAFARSRGEDKPIFLSVGYSTCHWCHVMEEESFEDPRIAELINAYFVAVKVDREERPDLDRAYMAFIQASTGGGGWPMTVFLTPELKPFFGGTYFPPRDRGGMAGLATILSKVRDAWINDRAAIIRSAGEVVDHFRRQAEGRLAAEGEPSPDILDEARRQAEEIYDPQHGGFGTAPKFPQPELHAFLFHEHDRTGQAHPRDMVLSTLRGMARGGICDQLGGGFHRYAVDAQWRVPHFEKMLYDQARLANSYLDAYQITRDHLFAEVAGNVLDYVLGEMTGPEGGFYSAQDADSATDASRPHRKREGGYYLWTAEEIRRLAGPDAAKVFGDRYGVLDGGNMSGDGGEESGPLNVLYQACTVEEAARHAGLATADAARLLTEAGRALLAARGARPAPETDDKTITAWNGMMISAFARGGAILGSRQYASAAQRAAQFCRRELYDAATGRLKRFWRAGEPLGDAFLDDYAFFIHGLLDLYQAQFDIVLLMLAADLQRRQDALFWDEVSGGYFDAASKARGEKNNPLPLRLKDTFDSPDGGGMSASAINLLRLSAMTGDKEFGHKARKILSVTVPILREQPLAMPRMLAAMDLALRGATEIVLAGRRGSAEIAAMAEAVHRPYVPNKVVLLADAEEGLQFLAKGLPAIAGMRPVNGRAAAYVCRNFTCRPPITDPKELEQVLVSRQG